MTGGSGKAKPSVSGLVGGSSRGNPGYSTTSGGGKSSVKQQETFFNGVWRKAKSFARPTSASNMSSRRPSIAVNSSASGGVASQGSKQVRFPSKLPPKLFVPISPVPPSDPPPLPLLPSPQGGRPGSQSPSMYSASSGGPARKERASTAGAGGSRHVASSSKHIGGFSTGLSPA